MRIESQNLGEHEAEDYKDEDSEHHLRHGLLQGKLANDVLHFESCGTGLARVKPSE